MIMTVSFGFSSCRRLATMRWMSESHVTGSRWIGYLGAGTPKMDLRTWDGFFRMKRPAMFAICCGQR